MPVLGMHVLLVTDEPLAVRTLRDTMGMGVAVAHLLHPQGEADALFLHGALLAPA